jgi:hypothetical protein
VNQIRNVALSILVVGSCYAQSPHQKRLSFDLSKIGMFVEGQQICEDKGRLQDYPSPEIEKITAAGTKSIPVLIELVTDGKQAKTREPIVCFWPGMAIGDIAFCLLDNLFLNAEWTNSTIPGASWNEMLDSPGDLPAWEQLHGFIRKHGRAALRNKWRKLWVKHGGQIFWDPKERCFKLKQN